MCTEVEEGLEENLHEPNSSGSCKAGRGLLCGVRPVLQFMIGAGIAKAVQGVKLGAGFKLCCG